MESFRRSLPLEQKDLEKILWWYIPWKVIKFELSHEITHILYRMIMSQLKANCPKEKSKPVCPILLLLWGLIPLCLWKIPELDPLWKVHFFFPVPIFLVNKKFLQNGLSEAIR